MVKKESTRNYTYTSNYDKGPIYNTCNSYTSYHNAGSKRLFTYIMCIHFGVSRTILKVVCLYVFPSCSQTLNVYNVHLEDDLKYYYNVFINVTM